MKTFLALNLTQLLRCHIIAIFINNLDTFDVMANRATVAFDILFTKLGLLYLFFTSQTDCFFLFSEFVNAFNFFRIYDSTSLLPFIWY